MSMKQEALDSPAGTQHESRRPSPATGLLILASVVVVVGSLVALASALKISDTWVAFLFALYWGGIERSDFKRLPHCSVGAAVGLTAAYLMHAIPMSFGPSALVPCILGILFLVYCQTMGWFPIAINMVTMLFLLVGTIPAIQAKAQYSQLMIALGVGALYFTAVVWLAKRITRRTATTSNNS